MNHRYKIYAFLTAFFVLCSAFWIYPNALTVHAKSNDFVVVVQTKKDIKIGEQFFLQSFTLSGKLPKFKSDKSSIASVDKYGVITGKKAGSARITASVTGHEAHCIVTVLPTTINLSHSKISLYRNQSFQLKATTSTKHTPTFKSSKSSVATVDANGKITAKKNGTTTIKVSCDGTTVTCDVTVMKPTITLSASTLTMTVGQTVKLRANVSSNNPVTWSVSNINVLSIDAYGNVTARQKGKAYAYASEDGTKVSCIIQVKDRN